MSIIKTETNKVLEYIKTAVGEVLPDNNLTEFLLGPSKRIRSKLCILYYLSAQNELNEDFYKVLAAGEIIHNASLLHDDVLDNAETRRGQTTIGAIYNPKISILCGDYLISQAIDLLLRGVNNEVNNGVNSNKILDIYKSCIEKMCRSEIRQYFLRGVNTNIDEYIDICRGKTASLFSAIFEASAQILGVDPTMAVKFAELYGICFQLKNDAENQSISQDKNNKIMTARDIIGLENVHSLTDNYKRNMLEITSTLSNNIYKNYLEDLVREL